MKVYLVMTIDELRSRVAQGEGLHVEFKRKLPEWEKLAREVVAFANTEGGFLFIGVDDSGELVGLRDAREVEEALEMNLGGYVHPLLPLTVFSVAISPKKSVVVLSVPRSLARPHRALEHPGFSDANVGQVLVRIADSSVRASKEMAEILRFEVHPKSVKVEIGAKERLLFKWLDENGSISLKRFAEIATLSEKAASTTLVHLVKGGLLQIVPQVSGEDLYSEVLR